VEVFGDANLVVQQLQGESQCLDEKLITEGSEKATRGGECESIKIPL
jgi:hypothetical protein